VRAKATSACARRWRVGLEVESSRDKPRSRMTDGPQRSATAVRRGRGSGLAAMGWLGRNAELDLAVERGALGYQAELGRGWLLCCACYWAR
jgi:hypothetical protein